MAKPERIVEMEQKQKSQANQIGHLTDLIEKNLHMTYTVSDKVDKMSEIAAETQNALNSLKADVKELKDNK